MDERELSRALDELAEEVSVTEAPVAAITTPERSGRPVLTALAAAAAVLAVVGVGVWVTDRDGGVPGPTGPSGSGSPTVPVTDPTAVAAGARLMGVGHVALEVPAGWRTNDVECGTPQHDTLIVDQGAICLALVPRPPDVETITLRRTSRPPTLPDFTGAAATEVDGVAGLATAPECHGVYTGPGSQQVRVCSASVFVPSEKALISAEAETRPAVLALLSTLRIVPDRVGLPAPNDFSAREGSAGDQGPSASGQAYLAALRDAGAEVEVVEEPRPAITPGVVLDVAPTPGTMLAPGDPVTVTVVAAQDSPAERVSVGLSWGEGGDDTSFTDEEIRAGATLRIRVGTPVWAYLNAAAPVQASEVVEQMSGDALVADHRNGPLWSWLAVRPGRATYTLSVRGEQIGQVRILVR